MLTADKETLLLLRKTSKCNTKLRGLDWRGHSLHLKHAKNVWRLGLCFKPHWGAHNAPH